MLTESVASSKALIPSRYSHSPPDSDGDGVTDNQDNCPNTAHQNQQDSDNDGTGNACDNSGGNNGNTAGITFDTWALVNTATMIQGSTLANNGCQNAVALTPSTNQTSITSYFINSNGQISGQDNNQLPPGGYLIYTPQPCSFQMPPGWCEQNNHWTTVSTGCTGPAIASQRLSSYCSSHDCADPSTYQATCSGNKQIACTGSSH